eukprot:TRINITY_DN4261_c0_g2_i1.p1 TRINITY_DN4261_c0_g2~~TRINITY_DN4261_c0_g2_i1.p1  ORF type:complete len:147 (-),score=39.13 TRINITY_DN4261_c0_g2_i1:142-582(-)
MCDVSDPAIAESYNDVRDDKSETNWALYGYEGNNKLVFVEKGAGGIAELKEKFNPDQAQYAFVRIISGDTESRRAKFVFISWCGENVSALKRAKMSVHKASVKTVVRDFAVEIHATTPEEVSEEEVNTKVRKAGGADYSGSLTGKE